MRAVIDNGAGHVLEILEDDGRETILIPFTLEAVPTVDIKAGRIVVDPPLGLLDDA